MRRLKSMGFSDKRLAYLAVQSVGLRDRFPARSGLIHEAVKAMAGGVNEDEVRALRHRLGVRPVFKRIDTCAAEFDAKTPYMYSTYEAPSFGAPECESQPSTRRKIVILGGGPNRIGQGIEFDYCCCHACFALADAGFETIMESLRWTSCSKNSFQNAPIIQTNQLNQLNQLSRPALYDFR